MNTIDIAQLIVDTGNDFKKIHKKEIEDFVEDYSKFLESYMYTLLGNEKGRIPAEHMIHRLRSMCL